MSIRRVLWRHFDLQNKLCFLLLSFPSRIGLRIFFKWRTSFPCCGSTSLVFWELLRSSTSTSNCSINVRWLLHTRTIRSWPCRGTMCRTMWRKFYRKWTLNWAKASNCSLEDLLKRKKRVSERVRSRRYQDLQHARAGKCN